MIMVVLVEMNFLLLNRCFSNFRLSNSPCMIFRGHVWLNAEVIV